jgi:hypothetical protein
MYLLNYTLKIDNEELEKVAEKIFPILLDSEQEEINRLYTEPTFLHLSEKDKIKKIKEYGVHLDYTYRTLDPLKWGLRVFSSLYFTIAIYCIFLFFYSFDFRECNSKDTFKLRSECG